MEAELPTLITRTYRSEHITPLCGLSPQEKQAELWCVLHQKGRLDLFDKFDPSGSVSGLLLRYTFLGMLT